MEAKTEKFRRVNLRKRVWKKLREWKRLLREREKESERNINHETKSLNDSLGETNIREQSMKRE